MSGSGEVEGPLDLTKEELDWLDSGGPFPPEVTINGRRYQLADRGDDGRVDTKRRRGKKGFVLRVVDPETNLDYAIKFCTPGDYTGERSPQAEARRAAALRNAPSLFVLPRIIGETESFSGQPKSHRWVCFVLDWLDGMTLAEALDDNSLEVVSSPDVVVDIARDLMQAVLVLRGAGLKHDDLKPSNIMLVPQPESLRVGRIDLPLYRLVVIDTGSLKPLAQPSAKEHDDWSRVVFTLVQLHNAFKRKRVLVSRYPQFMPRLKQLIVQLADEDVSRHFVSDREIFEAFGGLLEPASDRVGTTPDFQLFEGISAEHLASDHQILQLFVRSLPWIEQTLSAMPTVVTGPRGCGKSMVFRYLSARTHLGAHPFDPNALDRVGVLGIYIPCASDLQNEVLWIGQTEGEAERLAAPLTTLFGLILARELLRTLALIENTPEISKHFGIGASSLHDIIAFIREFLPEAPSSVRLRSKNVAEDFANQLDQMRIAHSRRVLRGGQVLHRLPMTFIRDVCRYLSDRVPKLRNLPVVFLLDDYTAPRIAESVQQVLNPIIWSRDAAVKFKVSCERWGFEQSSVGGIRIDEDREFAKVDAGKLTLTLTSSGKLKFVTQLMNRRLALAGYHATIEELLGPSQYQTDSALAKHLRDGRQTNSKHYHGVHVFANLLSGDVATLLHFGRNIFARASVSKNQRTLVSRGVQHDAIVDVSRSLLSRINGFYPHGPAMYAVASAFGELVGKVLREGEVGKKGEPRRMPRIEFSRRDTEDFYQQLGRVDTAAQSVARELIRRSVFIDLSRGRAKEGVDYHTQRWQLRAALLPAFSVALRKNHYFDIKLLDDFVELLMNPAIYCAKLYKRYQRGEAPPQDLFEHGGRDER